MSVESPTGPVVLPDAADRRRVATDLDTSMFVEAGAGTGKTTVLVERIVALVGSGRTTIGRIAAITFTEAAADELRDRVRRALQQATEDLERDPDERKRCEAGLAELDDAVLTTLHGFARRILAAHPLAAGLPPVLEVADEVRTSVEFDQRWSLFFEALLADPDLQPVLERGFLLGLQERHLRDIARQFHQHWDRLAPPPPPPPPPPPVPTPARGGPALLTTVDPAAVVGPLRQALALRSGCTDDGDKLAQHLDGLVPVVDRLQRVVDDGDDAVLDALGDTPKLTCSHGRQKSWVVPLDDVRDLLREAQDGLDVLLERSRREVLEVLLDRLAVFTLEGVEARRAEGRLEFHDLLVLCRTLLRDVADVRAAVHRSIRHLLIDEFQDTDPLQVEIAMALAGAVAGDGVAVPWYETEVEPGRLFVVGDPKQSIYRFRRADIELYERVRGQFGDVAHLRTNFRSEASVLHWVNEVFSGLMGGGAKGQALYVDLEHPTGGPTLAGSEDVDARHADQACEPRVTVIGGPVERKGTTIDAIRSVEADEVTCLVQRAKAECWPVRRRDGESGPPYVRFDDVAILLPTRAALPAVERSLEDAGVPYRVESRSLVWSTQEVRELLEVLRAIDDPSDQVALIAALRAPAFACGDDDLLDFHRAGGRWDYRRPLPPTLPAGHPVVEAFAALGRLHDRRWWQPFSELVAEVVDDRQLLALAFTRRRPREVWNRLRFVVDQARAFAEAGGTTLRAFVHWAERQADERTSVVETVVPESDDDAVRIMTVHASKGLEFPVVVLAGLNAAAQGSRGDANVVWNHDGPEVRFGRSGSYWVTLGFDQRYESDQQLEDAEKVRLLYVAATRARDHLVVSLHHKVGPTSPASSLLEHVLRADDLSRRPEGALRPVPFAAPARGPAPSLAGHTEEDRERWAARRRAVIAQASRPASVAATTLGHPQAQGARPIRAFAPAVPPGDAGSPVVGHLDPLALGRAVHAALQAIGPVGGAEVDEVARQRAGAEGIGEQAGEVAARVRSALAAPALREAAAGGTWWLEVYVGAEVAGTLLEGFVDLLYEAEDGLVVVDYKTDAVDPADLDGAVERHRLQMAAYAVALEQGAGRTVARCELVFALPSGPLQCRVPDLAEAMRTVVQQLGGSGAAVTTDPSAAALPPPRSRTS